MVNLTLEIHSVKEKLPKGGTYEKPHKVFVFDENGEFTDVMDYYAKRTPQITNPSQLKGCKGFVKYEGDWMWFEYSPAYWCEIPGAFV